MIQGVFAPTVPAMRPDQPDPLDGPATRRHIERILAGGVHSFAPGGTSGEFIALSLAQRQPLVVLDIQQRYVAASNMATFNAAYTSVLEPVSSNIRYTK